MRSDLNAYLEHVLKITNMSCMTPKGALLRCEADVSAFFSPTHVGYGLLRCSGSVWRLQLPGGESLRALDLWRGRAAQPVRREDKGPILSFYLTLSSSVLISCVPCRAAKWAGIFASAAKLRASHSRSATKSPTSSARNPSAGRLEAISASFSAPALVLLRNRARLCVCGVRPFARFECQRARFAIDNASLKPEIDQLLSAERVRRAAARSRRGNMPCFWGNCLFANEIVFCL